MDDPPPFFAKSQEVKDGQLLILVNGDIQEPTQNVRNHYIDNHLDRYENYVKLQLVFSSFRFRRELQVSSVSLESFNESNHFYKLSGMVDVSTSLFSPFICSCKLCNREPR